MPEKQQGSRRRKKTNQQTHFAHNRQHLNQRNTSVDLRAGEHRLSSLFSSMAIIAVVCEANWLIKSEVYVTTLSGAFVLLSRELT